MIVDTLKSILENEGYIVNTKLQEKVLRNKELIILILDLDVDVESFNTYTFRYNIGIIFNTDNPSYMVDEIKNIISLIENNLNTSNLYQFINVELSREGTLYVVTIVFEYVEVV